MNTNNIPEFPAGVSAKVAEPNAVNIAFRITCTAHSTCRRIGMTWCPTSWEDMVINTYPAVLGHFQDMEQYADDEEQDEEAEASTRPTTHCLRCGRTLASAASQVRGYGRTCAAKVRAAAKAKAAADFKPATAAKAIELIEVGGIVAIRPRVFRTVSSDGTRTYLTAPEACNCAAGLKGKHMCFHRAAAAIMLAA